MQKEVRHFLDGGAAIRDRFVAAALPARRERVDVSASLQRLLDDAHATLLGGNAASAVAALVSGLRRIRMLVTPDEWLLCVERCVSHPVRKLIHHDPWSRKAFEQRASRPEDEVTESAEDAARAGDLIPAIGPRVHAEMMKLPWAAAVRFRRQFVGRTIDECAATNSALRVLAIGEGRLQALAHSFAYRAAAVGEVVAAERDGDGELTHARSVSPASHAEVEGGRPAGLFGLACASSALDALDHAAAASLVRRMFDLLQPGGMLVVSSLSPDLQDAAFIEAFLGRQPRYRTAYEVLELMRGLGRKAATRLGADERGSVVFAAVRRVAA